MDSTSSATGPHGTAAASQRSTNPEEPPLGTAMRLSSLASEQQYREIFAAVSDGLIVNDLETGLVLEANPAACRMHGYDDMTGLHPSVFIHPESHHLFANYVAALREGREYRCRAKDVRHDGSIFDVEVLGRRVTYYGKDAMLGVVRDISDQVSAYQELERRVEERTSEIERRRRVAEGMRELIAVVNSNQAVNEVLEYLVDQARVLLESDASAVFLPVAGRENEVLGVRAASGLPPEHPYVRMPVGTSSTGLAFSRRMPVLLTDLRAALPPTDAQVEALRVEEHASYIEVVGLPSFLETPELEDATTTTFGMRTFASIYGALLSVPLATPDEAYGTLCLYYHDPREFSADDVSLANAFAGQAVLALENARLREQAGQAAVLEERQRLARELHDAVTQTLFSASLISEVIPDLWEKNPDDARRRLDQLRRLTRSALAEMRLLLLELRPTALTDIALADLLRQLVEATSGVTHATINLTLEGDERARVDPAAQIALYRVAQEALNNVVKHAKASIVDVGLHIGPEGCVELVVRDDGLGFDPTSIPAGHLGVGIMHERAESIGARVDVASSLGAGTEVRIHWQGTKGNGG